MHKPPRNCPLTGHPNSAPPCPPSDRKVSAAPLNAMASKGATPKEKAPPRYHGDGSTRPPAPLTGVARLWQSRGLTLMAPCPPDGGGPLGSSSPPLPRGRRKARTGDPTSEFRPHQARPTLLHVQHMTPAMSNTWVTTMTTREPHPRDLQTTPTPRPPPAHQGATPPLTVAADF